MSGCDAIRCIDVYDPVKVRRLKEWAESDAEFLRKLSLTTKENLDHHPHQENSSLLSAAYYSSNNITTKRSGSLHEGFAGRQRFIRSYTFDQEKETLPTRFLQMIKQFLLKRKNKRKGKKNGGHSNRDCSCSPAPMKGTVLRRNPSALQANSN